MVVRNTYFVSIWYVLWSFGILFWYAVQRKIWHLRYLQRHNVCRYVDFHTVKNENMLTVRLPTFTLSNWRNVEISYCQISFIVLAPSDSLLQP
jgi:hypothetical protein